MGSLSSLGPAREFKMDGAIVLPDPFVVCLMRAEGSPPAGRGGQSIGCRSAQVEGSELAGRN